MHTDINPAEGIGSEPRHLTRVGGTLYFSADDGLFGRELWTTNLKLKADDLLFEILAKSVAYQDWATGSTVDIEATGNDWPVSFEVTAFRSPATVWAVDWPN